MFCSAPLPMRAELISQWHSYLLRSHLYKGSGGKTVKADFRCFAGQALIRWSLPRKVDAETVLRCGFGCRSACSIASRMLAACRSLCGNRVSPRWKAKAGRIAAG